MEFQLGGVGACAPDALSKNYGRGIIDPRWYVASVMDPSLADGGFQVQSRQSSVVELELWGVGRPQVEQVRRMVITVWFSLSGLQSLLDFGVGRRWMSTGVTSPANSSSACRGTCCCWILV